MTDKEKIPWVICGRQIGTASGWDQADTFVIQLYDLEGGEGYLGPSGPCVTIDFENGRIEAFDDDGKVTIAVDLLYALNGAPFPKEDMK